jgi:beta-lactamase regulating signal transducer with metallopeptidase domain
MRFLMQIRAAIIGLTTVLSLMLLAAPASAYNPFQPPSCSNGGAAQVCVCNSSTTSTATCSSSKGVNQNPVLNAIKTVADIIAVVAGLAAVITLMVGGFSYITSAGNTEATNKARSRIIGALVGIVIIALAWFIVSFVISRLIK